MDLLEVERRAVYQVTANSTINVIPTRPVRLGTRWTMNPSIAFEPDSFRISTSCSPECKLCATKSVDGAGACEDSACKLKLRPAPPSTMTDRVPASGRRNTTNAKSVPSNLKRTEALATSVARSQPKAAWLSGANCQSPLHAT